MENISAEVRWSYPADLAIGKEVYQEGVRNTDDVYVLDEGAKKVIRVNFATRDTQEFRFTDDLNFHVYSIETDACGRVYVSCSDDKLYVLEFLPTGAVIIDVFPGPPFNKIHDIYVSGNEVIVSERWTDSSGISLFRLGQECVDECCGPSAKITYPRERQTIREDSVPIIGKVYCKGYAGVQCENGYIKYWALYIAPGWDIVGTFAFLTGAPGATDDEDTLCWLVADTFPAGNYTLLLRGVSNDPGESPVEDRVKISIRHGLPTDPTITYMRKPDGTQWYPMMSIVPMSTPVEVGWRIVESARQNAGPSLAKNRPSAALLDPERARKPAKNREKLLGPQQLDPACGGGYYNMALSVKEA